MSPPSTPRDFVSFLISSIQSPERSSSSDHSSNPLKDASSSTQKALLTLHILFPNELLPALDLLDRNLVTRLTVTQDAAQQPPDSGPGQPTILGSSGPAQAEQSRLRIDRLHHARDDAGRRALQEAQPRQPGLPEHSPQSDLRREDEHQLEDEQGLAGTHHGNLSQHQSNEDLAGQHSNHEHGRHSIDHCSCTRHTTLTEIFLVRSGQHGSRSRGAVSHTTSYEVRLNAWSCSCPAFAFSAFPAVSSDRSLDHDVLDECTNLAASPVWRFGGLTLGADMPVCKHLLACALVEHSGIFANFAEDREVSIEELAGLAAGWAD